MVTPHSVSTIQGAEVADVDGGPSRVKVDLSQHEPDAFGNTGMEETHPQMMSQKPMLQGTNNSFAPAGEQ